jgi:hypothetical protein
MAMKMAMTTKMMTNIVKAIVSLSYFSFDIMLFLSVDSGTDDNVDKDDRDGNQDDDDDNGWLKDPSEVAPEACMQAYFFVEKPMQS